VRRFVDTRPDVELLDSETSYLDGDGEYEEPA